MEQKMFGQSSLPYNSSSISMQSPLQLFVTKTACMGKSLGT